MNATTERPLVSYETRNGVPVVVLPRSTYDDMRREGEAAAATLGALIEARRQMQMRRDDLEPVKSARWVGLTNAIKVADAAIAKAERSDA